MDEEDGLKWKLQLLSGLQELGSQTSWIPFWGVPAVKMKVLGDRNEGDCHVGTLLLLILSPTRATSKT